MEARVCDRNEKHVILGDDVEKSGTLSVDFVSPGGSISFKDWDICPGCVGPVLMALLDRVMLWKEGDPYKGILRLDTEDTIKKETLLPEPEADLAREGFQDIDGLSLEEALREKASQEKDSKGSKR